MESSSSGNKLSSFETTACAWYGQSLWNWPRACTMSHPLESPFSLLWPLKSTGVLYLSSSTCQPQDAVGGWFMLPGCIQGCHFFSTGHRLYQTHKQSDPSQVSWLIVSWISHLDLWLSISDFKETNITYLFNLCLKTNSLLLGNRNVGKCWFPYCVSEFPNFSSLLI